MTNLRVYLLRPFASSKVAYHDALHAIQTNIYPDANLRQTVDFSRQIDHLLIPHHSHHHHLLPSAISLWHRQPLS